MTEKKTRKKTEKVSAPVLTYTKLSDTAIEPERGTPQSSGIDVFSPGDYKIPPMRDVLIPLNLAFDIPEGYDLSGYNKSGVSTKKKLIIGANLIDQDYTGNVHVHLFNISNKEVVIRRGDKISQLVLRPVSLCALKEVKKITKKTERGSGGFGSTGDKKEK